MGHEEQKQNLIQIVILQQLKYIYLEVTIKSAMNFNKNVKRSVTYEFELKNSKLLPAARYRGNSKLYQLNLSKMLLKCPDSPFSKNNDVIENPEELVIVSSSKYNLTQKSKQYNFLVNRKSDLTRTKLQGFKSSVKNNLKKQDLLLYRQTFDRIDESDDKYNRTIESPKLINPYIQLLLPEQRRRNSQSHKISGNPSYKNFSNQAAQFRQKKLYESSVQSKKDQEQKFNQMELLIISNQKSGNKSSEITQTSTFKLEKNIQKKQSFNFTPNQQALKRLKQSKKIMLPQIKATAEKNQTHTYNIAVKSNIPMLYRDPEDLKSIKSQSYSVIQYPSGNLILSNKGMSQYEIASLTKIMTFYTTKKIISKFHLSIAQEKVKINDNAMQMSGTSAQILSGQIYTVQQLLYGLMLPSGNDAATALAQWGGKQILKNHHSHLIIHSNVNNSLHFPNEQTNQQPQQSDSKERIKIFINEMNLNAKQLGLSLTRFANQHGLPNPQSKSTAIDVARLCSQCLKDQFFVKVVSTHKYKCMTYHYSNKDQKRAVEWINTNKLLRREGFIGIKTGITVTAGPCLASAYKFRDKIYICVVLRATKVSRRFKQTRKILAWSLQKLYRQSFTNDECKILNSLKKNKPDLDSDYSEDQQQFNYQQMSKAEIKKRSNIINYQM